MVCSPAVPLCSTVGARTSTEDGQHNIMVIYRHLQARHGLKSVGTVGLDMPCGMCLKDATHGPSGVASVGHSSNAGSEMCASPNCLQAL